MLKKRLRGAFAIVGYSMQMMNPPLDPTALMRKIGFLWMNSIPGMRSLIIKIIYR